MFADDLLIYNYYPLSQTSITAQKSLDKVTDWCGSWLLRTNASPWSSPGLELPLRATILLIASYLPKYLHTNILGWFFPVIYLGNPTYCLLLQDRTDYWAYSSGHLDLTLRLFLLVIKSGSFQYWSMPVKRGIHTSIFYWKTWMRAKERCKMDHW